MPIIRWKRTIFFHDHIIAMPVWPGSGIVAGSPHATFELTLYTVTVIRELDAKWPAVRVSIRVHDVTLQVEAASKPRVARIL